MPKAPAAATSVHNAHGYPPGANGPGSAILRRNQACHQCRRRKLKCDAERPCGTCVRSHKNAVKTAAPGVQVPPLECTFDEITEDKTNQQNVPKNRYERLENRINELESLLRLKDQGTPGNASNGQVPGTASAHPTMQSQASLQHQFSSGSALPMLPQQSSSSFTSHSSSPDIVGQVGSMSMYPASGPPSTTSPPTVSAHISPILSSPPSGAAGTLELPQPDTTNQLLHSDWPRNLPSPGLVRHLVECVFSYIPNASRLFHTSTFLASLAFPPSHPNFPCAAILHAMCALGSTYSAAVPPPPPPNFATNPADNLFGHRRNDRDAPPESFGERHARMAWALIEESGSSGEYLFEGVQANVILVWFYYSQARWSVMFLMSGRALRHAVPLGLNMCPPFHSISLALRAPSILQPAKTVIEDEIRRNTFWLAYSTERYCSAGNGWAMSLDDQDVSQLMPCRKDQFERGVLVPPNQRQWAHGADLLLHHPPEQTDSFSLYIKASILISKVKTFNLRFRMGNFSGDPQMATPFMPSANGVDNCIDPRDSPAFKEVENLVSAFLASFPSNMKDPIQDNIVDTNLLVACMATNVAIILLHDPHSNVKRRDYCRSAQKIHEAAHAILNYLYAIWSSSFDITLVDSFCTFALYMSAKVLGRFLHGAHELNDQAQVIGLTAEIEFIRLAVQRIGTRTQLALKFAKLIDDIMTETKVPTDRVILTQIQAYENGNFPSNQPINSLNGFSFDSLFPSNGGAFAPDLALGLF